MEHILVEHISGYDLFELKEFEDLATTSYSNYMSIVQIVNHVSSLPFKDANEALSHIISNNSIHPQLIAFLELNGVKILHCDRSYKPLLDNYGIEYKSSPNIMRGIRENLKKLLKKELDKQMTLSVSHSFSKEAIRYSLEQEDHLVIVVGNEIDQLENEIDSLKIKLQSMINWHVPLLKKFVKEKEYQNILDNIFNKKSVPEESKDIKLLNNNIMDNMIAEMISELNSIDNNILREMNRNIKEKTDILESLKKYLEKKMKVVAPNLRQILGDRLASKLINKSAGLTNLGLYPSSTLQLLGAEKSLYQSLKSRSRTPKHGILFNMDNLRGDRGKLCRFIASKCSLAARIDAFSKERCDYYGKELKKLIDKKIRTNSKPEKTEEVMERVYEKLQKNKLTENTKASGDKKINSSSKDFSNVQKQKVVENIKASGDKKINSSSKDFSNGKAPVIKQESKHNDNQFPKHELNKSTKKRFDDLTESSKAKMGVSEGSVKKQKKNDHIKK